MKRDAAELPQTWFSVTVHDVAPATQARCEALLARIERIAPIRFTLLVVPYYHGQPSTGSFEQWLDGRLHGGDELALHGLTHRDDASVPRGWLDHARRRWYTAGEGEFAAIDFAEATRRLNAGRRWFAARRWPLRGFVAPAWLLGDGAWRALQRQPLRYTCTRTALQLLPHAVRGPRRARDAALPTSPGAPAAHMLRARSIVYSTRARWRRWLSLPWNEVVARSASAGPWMRFELHPADAEHDDVCAAISQWIERALAQRRSPLTLAAVAERLRERAWID